MDFMKDKEEENTEEWLLTYSDMVTLVLCFFVLLAAVSEIDMTKFEQIKANMAKKLNDRNILSPIEMIVKDLENDISSLEITDSAGVYNDKKGVVLEMSSSLLFSDGGYLLKDTSEPILKRIAATMNAERYESFHYQIQGHTDEITKEGLTSWDLSALRASVIVNFFISREIKGSRFEAIGLADNQPKVPNFDTYGNEISQNRAINRRIVVKIEPSR